MHIIHIAAEIAPVAKVGGLADVILGFSHGLKELGHHVEIVLPKYDCIEYEGVEGLTSEPGEFVCNFNGGSYKNTIWRGKVLGLDVFFIEPHHPAKLFERGTIYGCADDINRFLYFSKIALEWIKSRKNLPHILHLHDWQTAVIAPLARDLYQLQAPKIVLTVHNFDYQGHCTPKDLEKVGLAGKKHLTPDKMQDSLQTKNINLLKGGIVFADFITTVSPRYAHEVLEVPGGRGLESTLLAYKHKFDGVLNGIDYDYWNPTTDSYLPTYYDSTSVLNYKPACKLKLQQHTKMAEENRPIVGCIVRLIPQKGVDLIKHAMRRTQEMGGQFVLLGSSPIPEMQREFEALKEQNTGNPHLHLALKHHEGLAHLIFSGSDMFIVPSLFEPCGLTQLIAMRYGTVPLVRYTGGLADTVFDVDHSGKPVEQANGYSFDYPDTQGMDYALNRAMSDWKNRKDRWNQLIINGMRTDFSWAGPTQKYLKIYDQILAN